MCRLALMNANILQVLSQQDLANLFMYLEKVQGGDGNGVAALWQETARVKIRKGITLTTAQAAQHLVAFSQAQADWLLYHTRLASSGHPTTRNCHPFQAGKLALAHNGHDKTWASLGRRLGITDSEFITRMWGRLSLPLETLMNVEGVFLGFHGSFPFVVKSRYFTDLVLAVNRSAGALLFVSQLPQVYRNRFDEVIELGHFMWLGVSPLDLDRLTRPRWENSNHLANPPARPEHDLSSANRRRSTEAAELTIEELRAFLEKVEARQKNSASAPVSAPLPSLPSSSDPTA
jgi:hypothetical protein